MKACPVCSREYPLEQGQCPDDGAALVALVSGARQRVEDLVGQVIDGRYRVERLIGKGGMGRVYAVRHVVVGKVAAMKVLRAGVEEGDGVLQRFVREAQAANAVRSRHIVEMSDFGQLPSGSFYMVMEHLEGESFGRLLSRGALDRRQLVHVFTQIARALEQAHRAGVVHRDLKPDNVFLVEEHGDPLFVKLLDFGIAKVIHADTSHLTETGVILGTPYYMSPEQARAEAVDHRTDIYALGVMMYRAFTGKLPFVADSAIGVLTAHLTETPELPSKVSDVDVPTERIILRCLEKKKEARFQSMAEVAAALSVFSIEAHPTFVDAPISLRPLEASTALPSEARPPLGEAPTLAAPSSDLRGSPAELETGAAKAMVTTAERPPARGRASPPLLLAGLAAMLVGGSLAVLAFLGPGLRGSGEGAGPATSNDAPMRIEVDEADVAKGASELREAGEAGDEPTGAAGEGAADREGEAPLEAAPVDAPPSPPAAQTLASPAAPPKAPMKGPAAPPAAPSSASAGKDAQPSAAPPPGSPPATSPEVRSPFE